MRRTVLAVVVVALLAAGLGVAPPSHAVRLGLTCDGYLINPDGTVSPTPAATGARGFGIGVSVTGPAALATGERTTLTVPSEATATIATLSVGGASYPVISQSLFVRTVRVTGGTVVPGSAVVTDPSAGAAAAIDGDLVHVKDPAEVPGGQTFQPSAYTFDVVAGDPATAVEVSAVKLQNVITIRLPDGAVASFQTDCVPDPNTLYSAAIVASRQVPATRADCRDGGWRDVVDDEGQPFTNQGRCISFVVARRPWRYGG